jgi:integrase
MTKRRTRGQGEGSIYQRASDGLWVAVLNLGWKDGKRDRRYFYAPTRAAVAEKLTEALGRRQRGLPADVRRQTVAQFLAAWLEEDVKPTREPKTYESYESTVRLHIVPDLGRHQLAKLEPQHVRALLRQKEAAGLSPRSVQYIRVVLRVALNQAARWDLVARNVAALVEPPKAEREEVRPWTREEAQRFLEHARGDRLGPLFSVALALGLRKAEALGLRWQDVELDGGVLHVRYQLQRLKGRGLVLKRPKTARSRRTIALPAPTVAALRAHRERQAGERLLAGARWRESGFVFATTIGTPLSPSYVNVRFNRLVATAGVPTQRFHDQRHWCATLLLAQGVPPRVVMDLLGHSHISTLMNTYGHVIEESRRQTADLMGRLLAGDDDPPLALGGGD